VVKPRAALDPCQKQEEKTEHEHDEKGGHRSRTRWIDARRRRSWSCHAAPPEAQSVVGDGKLNVTLSVDGQRLGVIQDVSLASAQSLASAVCPVDDSRRASRISTPT
jgi:hypothetical protein